MWANGAGRRWLGRKAPSLSLPDWRFLVRLRNNVPASLIYIDPFPSTEDPEGLSWFNQEFFGSSRLIAVDELVGSILGLGFERPPAGAGSGCKID